MVISSLVVDTLPEQTAAVKAAVAALPGAEVHSVEEGRKLVVTIEAETVDASHAVAAKMEKLEGVIGVELVYVNFEDDPTIYPDGV